MAIKNCNFSTGAEDKVSMLGINFNGLADTVKWDLKIAFMNLQQQGWAGNCGFKVRGGEKIKVTASAIKKVNEHFKKLCVEKGGKNYFAVFFRKLS